MTFFKPNSGGGGGFPKAPFLIIRLFQLISCTCVLGVLGYFQYHLWQDGYGTPYEFSLLDFAASVTLFDIFLATIFIACYGLSPVYVIVVQSILTIFWVICFGLLLRALGESMTASCSVDNWGNGAGARVCHLFKMLVAFSLFSILSLVAMLVAAVVVRRRGGAAHGYSPTANSVRVGHKATATATVIATDTVYHPPPADGAPPPAYSPPGTNAAAAAGP